MEFRWSPATQIGCLRWPRRSLEARSVGVVLAGGLSGTTSNGGESSGWRSDDRDMRQGIFVRQRENQFARYPDAIGNAFFFVLQIL
jgi:hypothetical protein